MKTNFSLDKILTIVSDYYQVDKEEIKAVGRKKNVVIPRQMFFYMVYEYTDKTLETMASFVNRNHATAIYSITKIRVEKEIYTELKEDINAITSKLHRNIIPDNIDLLQLCINYTNSFIH